MIEPSTLCAQIEAWTREAVEQWGQDWPRISAYLQGRMTLLAPDERLRLHNEAALTLLNGEDGAVH